MRLPDCVDGGSLVIYPPMPKDGSPDSQNAARMRDFVIGLKTGKMDRQRGSYADIAAAAVVKHGTGPLLDLFHGTVTLIPVPRSGLTKDHSLWPARLLCDALNRKGIGVNTVRALSRTTAIRKSATSPDRPTVQEHVASLHAQASVDVEDVVVLVDDVVTRGSTILGCAWRLADVMPKVTIRAFAFARTLRDSPTMLVPAKWVITTDGSGRNGVLRIR
ncbi:MAG: hypothetical protein JNM38_25300 [Acidobacteria bacterium]|nr:hypothetical protein [Acidobacteriota bacterium]